MDLRLDSLTYSVCSRKVFEKRYQAALWAWPLQTPFPRLYETFSSELAYDARGNPVGNTNNIMAVSDAELDAALDAERNAPDTGSLKLALHRAQQRLYELCVWIPGLEGTLHACRLLALDTLAGISHPVLFPQNLQSAGIAPVLGG